MSRAKIDLPENFSFQCSIPIRITDVNYGNHVGNDTMLSLLHEARMQYLNALGYTEMNMEGIGMIMSDVSIEFRNELFYGDMINIAVAATDFSRAGFTLVYKAERAKDSKLAAVARTGMVCYDYSRKKIVSIPDLAKAKLQGS